MQILKALGDLISRKKKVEPAPFDLEKWVRAFKKAPAQKKSVIAEKWLKHYLAHIDRLLPWETQTVEAVIRHTLLPKIVVVRDMVNAVGADCAHLVEDSADSIRVAAMKRYLAVDRELSPDEVQSYYPPRLRTMLLSQSLDARLSAFYEMASEKTNLRAMHKGASSLLRAATWDLAQDEGMSNTMTAAATQLMVWSHLFRPLPFISSLQPQCHAIEALLWGAQCGAGRHGLSMPLERIKEHLTAHPAAAATLLYYFETESTFAVRGDIELHPRSASENEKLATLLDWIPRQSGVINLAQQLGIPYMETLEQIKDSFSTRPVLELPEDIELSLST